MRAFLDWGRRRLWVFGLAAALAFIAVDGAYRLRTVWFVTDIPIAGRTTPAPDDRSPSGYAWNQHYIIPPAMATDGMHFLMQTQEMLAGGDARIRQATYDGPPGGREVHWSSLLRWWTAGLAWLDHQLTGLPLPLAAERDATWANTLILVVVLLVLTPVAARRFGSIPAALLAIGMVAPYPLYEFFCASEYDHHGLAAVGGLLTVLFLLAGGAGWVRRTPEGKLPAADSAEAALAAWLPERARARRWFIASGIAGGFGLWISAASGTPVLVGTGLGVLLGPGLLGRNPPANAPWRADATLWRVWGVAGAGASLFFYILEYFPVHFGWRLEVNHPLFALAWLGGGDFLCRVCRRLHGAPAGAVAGPRRDYGWMGLDLALVAALPVTILLTKAATFWVADPYLWALHKDYIVEFKSLFAVMRDLRWSVSLGLINALPLVALALAALLWVRTLPRPWKGLLVLALLPSALMLGLAVAQIRWLGICCALSVAVLVAAATIATAAGPGFRWTLDRRVIAALLLAAALLPNPCLAVKNWVLGWDTPNFGPENALMLATRDVAQHLRGRVGGQPVRLASGSLTSTWLTYFGGFPTLGTFYWENLAGLKGMGELYAARSQDEARAVVRKYGLNYIVICSWDAFADEYARLGRGRRAGDPVPADAFIYSITQTPRLPAWLRPIYYELPKHDHLKNSNVFIYEVVPDQTERDLLVHIAKYQLQARRPELAAGALNALLGAQPDYLPALITAARTQFAFGQPDAAAATTLKLRARLDEAATLALDDRVDLAVLLARVQDYAACRTQLTAALQTANEASLRRLRPDALFDFLSLAYQLDLTGVRPGLFSFATSLLPPEGRAQLAAIRAKGPVTLSGSPAR